eukprot:CAMPEP_0194155682 /NCGR_PEP_ID=MMETSP0152-20130528/65512_1 /TAXON_ID=1049557 /ORGANISM="Thalassiothrix antarctica, Strain L6-D1" /LENGTH=250 /DNA_ID=CAMNT_0038862763 /DNA_START=35 /DNA_END=787 /DNA_ORIENTATION=-
MTSFSVGDLVRIQGLQGKPEWNSQIGVVMGYHDNQDRYEILPSRGKKTLAIKAINLTNQGFIASKDPDFGQKRAFDNLFVWPSVQRKEDEKTIIPVQGFLDLPETSRFDWEDQDNYIRNLLKWKSVDNIGGVEEHGRDKATFMLLFDGSDGTSPINHAAQSMMDSVPNYKKSSHPKDLKLRGVCVLTYSPTKSTLMSSSGFESQQMVESNPDRRFTHQQLYDIVKFHSSDAAKKQYKAHDNPLHRVFGGL